jgi:hypothetical protein
VNIFGKSTSGIQLRACHDQLCLISAIKRSFKGNTQMSKSKKATPAPVVATPVVAQPPVTASGGRTIVAIAKELKISPVNARRLARQHASELGHSAKGQRWELSPDQAKRFIELATAPKVAKTVAA